MDKKSAKAAAKAAKAAQKAERDADRTARKEATAQKVAALKQTIAERRAQREAGAEHVDAVADEDDDDGGGDDVVAAAAAAPDDGVAVQADGEPAGAVVSAPVATEPEAPAESTHVVESVAEPQAPAEAAVVVESVAEPQAPADSTHTAESAPVATEPMAKPEVPLVESKPTPASAYDEPAELQSPQHTYDLADELEDGEMDTLQGSMYDSPDVLESKESNWNSSGAYHGYTEFDDAGRPAFEPAANDDSVKQLQAVNAEVSAPAPSCEFNNRYQAVLDLVAETPDEKLKQSQQLLQISKEFAEQAAKTVKTIVQERHLPAQSKTIPPISAGGVAGGEKYLVGSIFYKFVADHTGLYGGDEFAQQSAGHELKGLRAYARAQVPGLRTPLMCLVDYHGTRVLASTVLPLKSGSLVYGSADAGVTVHDDEPTLSALMRQAATSINLEPHLTGSTAPKELCACCDIEGHRGADSRFYVIDTARVMPPEAPTPTTVVVLVKANFATSMQETRIPRRGLEQHIAHLLDCTANELTKHELAYPLSGFSVYMGRRSGPVNERLRRFLNSPTPVVGDGVIVGRVERVPHLTRLLRPEFVSTYEHALSSDAFSGFGMHNASAHNTKVRQATAVLQDKYTKHFAEQVASYSKLPSNDAQLVAMLHEAGINIRYLGLIRYALPPNHEARRNLLSAMISRVVKNRAREQLRAAAANGAGVPELMGACLDLFNRVFGLSLTSKEFWTIDCKVLLGLKFSHYASPAGWKEAYNPYSMVVSNYQESHPLSHLRAHVSLLSLLGSLQQSIGLVLTIAANRRFQQAPFSFDAPFPFQGTDVEVLSPKLRTLIEPSDVLHHVQAVCKVSGSAQSVEQARQYLSTVSDVFGDASPQAIGAELHLAQLLSDRAEDVASVEHCNRAIAHLAHRVDVPVDVSVAALMLLGSIKERAGALYDAQTAFQKALKLLEDVYGTGHRYEVDDAADEQLLLAAAAQSRVESPRVVQDRMMREQQAATARLSQLRSTFGVKSPEYQRAKAETAAARKSRTAASKHATVDAYHASRRQKEFSRVVRVHPLAAVLADRIVVLMLRRDDGISAKAYLQGWCGEGIHRASYHEKAISYARLAPFPSSREVCKRFFGAETPISQLYTYIMRNLYVNWDTPYQGSRTSVGWEESYNLVPGEKLLMAYHHVERAWAAHCKDSEDPAQAEAQWVQLVGAYFRPGDMMASQSFWRDSLPDAADHAGAVSLEKSYYRPVATVTAAVHTTMSPTVRVSTPAAPAGAAATAAVSPHKLELTLSDSKSSTSSSSPATPVPMTISIILTRRQRIDGQGVTVYTLQVQNPPSDWTVPNSYQVDCRFSQVLKLRAALIGYTQASPPELPPAGAGAYFGRFKPEVVHRRSQAMNALFQFIATHAVLHTVPAVVQFFTPRPR